jgi:DNA-binding NtrC family response regulator
MNLTHRSKGTVLVIDDHPGTMQMLIAALQTCGVTIVVAPQGEPALELVTRMTPDLILLEVRQPDMQGIETFRGIRANPASHDIPIIVISSAAETQAVFEATAPESNADGERAGVDYLTTPFLANEVLARVTAHLTIGKLKRQLSEQQPQENMNFREAIEAYEKNLIDNALEHNHGNMAQTASDLSIPLLTLYRKIKHYQLS